MAFRLIKLLVSLCLAGADRIAVAVARVLGQRSATPCVVLYYHAVRATERGRFASQMDELMHLSIPIDIENSESPPSKSCRYAAVTFDDGFVSVVENALPELRARNIPCTIFVPTGSIGQHPSWLGQSHGDASEVVASAEMLRTIADQPLVRIGSHSVSHPDFRCLGDGQARDELARSKTTLEELLGREVKSFSFPHGAYLQRSLDLARQCGYVRVFTIEPVQLASPGEGFVVGRVRVEPLDWPIEFRLKVLGAYRWMVSASAIKKELLGLLFRGRVQAPQPRQGI